MSSSTEPPRQRRKLCFVTVGATAPFDGLIEACQTTQFLSALELGGYTNLLIQHGHKNRRESAKESGQLKVTSFDFRKDGIWREMMVARGDLRRVRSENKAAKKQAEANASSVAELPGLDLGADWLNDRWEEGVVISHAGSGSILDALRLGVPTIVVPNEKLLDNHQVELAEELSRQGYVAHGHLNDLPSALREADLIRQNRRQWPPPIDKTIDPSGKGLIGVMDEEMGYRDLKSSIRG